MLKFLLGVFVGSQIGMIVLALVTAAKKADHDMGIDDKN